MGKLRQVSPLLPMVRSARFLEALRFCRYLVAGHAEESAQPDQRKPSKRIGPSLASRTTRAFTSAKVPTLQPPDENTVAKAIGPGPTSFLEFLSHANCFHVVHGQFGDFNQMFIMRELNDGPVRLCSSSEPVGGTAPHSSRIA